MSGITRRMVGAQTITVAKTADESVTSSTVLQADDHLTIDLPANTSWAVEVLFVITGVNAGDFKFDFSGPSGATGYVAVTGLTSPATATAAQGVFGVVDLADSSGTTIGTVTGSTTFGIGHGFISVGATAGALALSWAQGTSDGTATTLKAGSWLQVTRV